ncbi:MAG: D-aminoacyl-tRNA deacylase [Gammaproteobacteria bacterium]|nr:D-aminoacyl-tRNA deacylase [Gammaproteobacteria bacterium]MCY4357325.1 D-aminoacyl-tRNA deacylase [Gammaproteobacteria bacterium]
MLALIQRVNYARLSIADELVSAIDIGILALIGIEKEDQLAQVNRLVDKLLAYRIFADADGKMNLGLREIGGGLMLVSQFTLAASTDKGLRPGFSTAKAPAEARQLFEQVVAASQARHNKVASGVFAAEMQIALENDGPVTFMLKV